MHACMINVLLLPVSKRTFIMHACIINVLSLTVSKRTLIMHACIINVLVLTVYAKDIDYARVHNQRRFADNPPGWGAGRTLDCQSVLVEMEACEIKNKREKLFRYLAPQWSCSCGPTSGKLSTQEPPLVMFLRHNGRVPAAQPLANSPRRNVHLSCSCATMVVFLRPNLWRTRHAGTLTRFSFYNVNKC